MMNALVVEDSPQIAERLVELVSVPNRVEVVATAATEDEALSACDTLHHRLAIVDLQLAQGTGFGVIRRLRAAAGSNPPASSSSPTTRCRRSRSPRSRPARTTSSTNRRTSRRFPPHRRAPESARELTDSPWKCLRAAQAPVFFSLLARECRDSIL
jgi:CheY-like chemotaxis protein